MIYIITWYKYFIIVYFCDLAINRAINILLDAADIENLKNNKDHRIPVTVITFYLSKLY